jgi:rod shape-determining protein MreD
MVFWTVTILAGIGLTIVESVLMPSLRIAGIGPDFIVLVVVVATRRTTVERSIFMAFFLGLIQDLFSVGLVGMSAFSLVLMVYILLFAEEYFLTDNWKAQVFVGFLGYLIFGGSFVFLKILAGYEIASAVRVAEIIFGTAAYTAVLTPLGFLLSYRQDLPAYMRLRGKYNVEHETLHQSEI